VTVLTATAAAAVALSSQAAQADPKPTKTEVKAKVDKLYDEAEVATEKFKAAEADQDKLEKAIAGLQDKVAREQDELNTLRAALGSVASAQYRTGSIDPSIQLFLSADPDDYLDKASSLDQLSTKQAEALRDIQAKQRTLAQQRKEAAAKLTQLSSTRKALGEKKQEVQSKLSEAQKLLNTLTAAEKAALDAAAAADAAASQRASRDSERSSLNTDTGSGGSDAVGSGRSQSAYAAAQSKLGSPYQYGANGPSTFDCSGLTSWAYAQAGVSIPRVSQSQANAGTRIYSQSDLKVGDLVFFYSDIHHVGFYAGNGQVLHAPRTGTVVRYEAMSNMPFQFGVRI
jgi:cell wall-associated NlpC family hydrolase